MLVLVSALVMRFDQLVERVFAVIGLKLYITAASMITVPVIILAVHEPKHGLGLIPLGLGVFLNLVLDLRKVDLMNTFIRQKTTERLKNKDFF